MHSWEERPADESMRNPSVTHEDMLPLRIQEERPDGERASMEEGAWPGRRQSTSIDATRKCVWIRSYTGILYGHVCIGVANGGPQYLFEKWIAWVLAILCR